MERDTSILVEPRFESNGLGEVIGFSGEVHVLVAKEGSFVKLM